MKKTTSLVILILTSFFAMSINAQCDILLWEDNFNSTGIDHSVWNVELDNSGGGNDELQYYTPRDTNVYIENGKLIIQALKEDFEGLAYTSGKLTTKGNADWKFGRIEAAIKMPAGRGIWPAFWMLPTENKYGGWPNSGEIDVVEMVAHDTNTVYGTLHYGPPWKYTNGLYSLDEGYFSDSVHLFALEWAADSIKWLVDDELYAFKTKDSLSKPEQWKIFQERFYIILNLAVGGNWPGEPNESTVFPQKMEIEYVRVYGDPAVQEIIAIDSAYAMAQNVRYSFTNIPGASFNWSVPPSAEIVSGQGSSSILVNWGCEAGNVELELTNIGCENQHYSLPVSFARLKISGSDQIYPLATVAFSAPELAETTYTWEVPQDAVMLFQEGDSLSVRWGCMERYVKVSTSNICTTESDSVLVSLLQPKLTGPTTVSENSKNIGYFVDPVPESDFTWTLPPDANIASGQGTESILANFGLEPGIVAVEIASSCYTKTLELTIRITDTVILADYESSFLEFETWASTSFKVVANPTPDNINSSPTVAETLKSEVAWSGIYADLGYNLNLKKHKIFHLKVLGPKSGLVLLKLEDVDVGTTPFKEVSSNYSTPGQWQELEFVFPDAATDVYDRITLFFDFGMEIENTYYFDDLTLLPSATSSSNSFTNEVNFVLYPNPAKDQLYVHLPYGEHTMLTVYNMQGRKLIEHNYKNRNSPVNISSLKSGTFLLEATVDGKQFRKLFIRE